MRAGFILLIILSIGIILRIYNLENFPVGLHIDEAQVGYNAYSLFLTGRDEFGNFLPTHLNIFGFSRPTQNFYVTALFVGFFGLSEFTTRFPTVLVGVLTIFVVYLLTFELFQKKSIAFIASLLLAISPWHIMFSRATSESIFEVFWVTTSFYFLYLFLKRKKIIFLILTYFSWVMSFFSYLPSRLVLPLLIVSFLLIFIKELRTKKSLITGYIIISVLFFIFPSLLFLNDKTGVARFKQVSIFTSLNPQLLLEEAIREDGQVNPIITRFFHNKFLQYGRSFVQNYGEYYTLSFWGLNGGYPPRYVTQNTGVIYLIEVPFLILGLYLFITKRKKEMLFIISWFFLAPFSSALTFEDSPNMQRSLLMVIPSVIMTGYGLYTTYNFLNDKYGNKKIIISGISILYILSLTFFHHQYFIHQKVHRPWHRMTEMKEMVSYINSVENKYREIIMTKDTTEPYIYFLFYNKIDPSIYQKQSYLLNAKNNWKWGKYMFIGNNCMPFETESIKIRKDILYVESSICEKDTKRNNYLYEVKRPDSSVALRMFTIKDPGLFKVQPK